MTTLIAWLKHPDNRNIEPRDLNTYLDEHPEVTKTVNKPDADGVTPLAFVAGRGDGDMASNLITRYGATATAAALQAYNAFVEENPEENNVGAQTWMRNLLKPVSRAGRRRKTTKRRRAATRRRSRAFQS